MDYYPICGNGEMDAAYLKKSATLQDVERFLHESSHQIQVAYMHWGGRDGRLWEWDTTNFPSLILILLLLANSHITYKTLSLVVCVFHILQLC